MSDERVSGFTLVETLVAFIILSLGMMMSAQTMSIATQSLSRAREERAILASLNRLDERLLDENEVVTGRGNDGANQWQVMRSRVDGSRDGREIITIRIVGPSGRRFDFLRFGGKKEAGP